MRLPQPWTLAYADGFVNRATSATTEPRRFARTRIRWSLWLVVPMLIACGGKTTRDPNAEPPSDAAPASNAGPTSDANRPPLEERLSTSQRFVAAFVGDEVFLVQFDELLAARKVALGKRPAASKLLGQSQSAVFPGFSPDALQFAFVDASNEAVVVVETLNGVPQRPWQVPLKGQFLGSWLDQEHLLFRLPSDGWTVWDIREGSTEAGSGAVQQLSGAAFIEEVFDKDFAPRVIRHHLGRAPDTFALWSSQLLNIGFSTGELAKLSPSGERIALVTLDSEVPQPSPDSTVLEYRPAWCAPVNSDKCKTWWGAMLVGTSFSPSEEYVLAQEASGGPGDQENGAAWYVVPSASRSVIGEGSPAAPFLKVPSSNWPLFALKDDTALWLELNPPPTSTSQPEGPVTWSLHRSPLAAMQAVELARGDAETVHLDPRFGGPLVTSEDERVVYIPTFIQDGKQQIVAVPLAAASDHVVTLPRQNPGMLRPQPRGEGLLSAFECNGCKPDVAMYQMWRDPLNAPNESFEGMGSAVWAPNGEALLVVREKQLLYIPVDASDEEYVLAEFDEEPKLVVPPVWPPLASH